MKNEMKKISALDYVAARKASSARAEATAASRLIAAAPDLWQFGAKRFGKTTKNNNIHI